MTPSLHFKVSQQPSIAVSLHVDLVCIGRDPIMAGGVSDLC